MLSGVEVELFWLGVAVAIKLWSDELAWVAGPLGVTTGRLLGVVLLALFVDGWVVKTGAGAVGDGVWEAAGFAGVLAGELAVFAAVVALACGTAAKVPKVLATAE